MHTNSEVLALVALGETDAASAEELDHIAHCPICEHEVTELGDLADVGRTISDHFTLEAPSPQVWERIRAELGFADDFSSRLLPSVGPDAPAPVSRDLDGGRPPEPERPGSPITPAATDSESDDVYPLDRVRGPRRRQVFSLALAAVLALLAGIGGTLAWQQLRTPNETVIASAPLDALPDWSGAAGEVKLEEDPSGRKVLVVTMSTPRPVDAIQQVWLIDRQIKGMVPVGQLTEPVERFTLSADVDVSRFPIVDISAEPPDGNVAHSGNSIVRGTLDV
ncbi:MAG: anti-sigma factor [Microlunatus sp.]|nr:anti-sigma factor [Microlunatus sp.]